MNNVRVMQLVESFVRDLFAELEPAKGTGSQGSKPRGMAALSPERRSQTANKAWRTRRRNAKNKAG